MIGIKLCMVVGLIEIIFAEGDTIININGKECKEQTNKRGPIVFSVGTDKDYTGINNEPIPMNHEFYNEGKYYDFATNRFVAPVTGVYSFFFGAASNLNTALHMTLYAGDKGAEKEIASTYTNDKINHGSASGFVYKKLGKGQTASLRLLKGYNLDGYIYPSTFFSGALFQQTED